MKKNGRGRLIGIGLCVIMAVCFVYTVVMRKRRERAGPEPAGFDDFDDDIMIV